MNYSAIRQGGGVRRFHCYRVVADDTVASHSWGVACVIDKLYNGNPPVRLLRAAMYHDIAEFKFGDIPSPAKRAMHDDGRSALAQAELEYEKSIGIEIDNLNEYEEKVLKFADCYDGLTYCLEEVGRGNQIMIEVANTYRTYLKEMQSFFQKDGLLHLPLTVCDNALTLLGVSNV